MLKTISAGMTALAVIAVPSPGYAQRPFTSPASERLSAAASSAFTATQQAGIRHTLQFTGDQETYRLVAASTGLPTIDIETTCRESERAIASIFGPGTQQTFVSCMKQENDARAQIVKDWQGYPAGGRRRCVNTTGYMPSYVEWLTCLEMEQSVDALRRKNPAAANPTTTEGRIER